MTQKTTTLPTYITGSERRGLTLKRAGGIGAAVLATAGFLFAAQTAGKHNKQQDARIIPAISQPHKDYVVQRGDTDFSIAYAAEEGQNVDPRKLSDAIAVSMGNTTDLLVGQHVVLPVDSAVGDYKSGAPGDQ